MKKLIVLLMVFVFVAGTVPAFAARDIKGASPKAYGQASDEAVFNRVGDWFATVGKSDEEKQAIIAQRKVERAKKKAMKEAEKKKKQMEKQAKKSQKQAKDKFKGLGKK
ncbi:MAG: hypothetical protein HQ594_00065 [Candidatus Omnitrophica bacterium]|nr:hypothetical protein [Candidatus Omnitrophota bacterium]